MANRSDARIFSGIGALVVALGLIVWWSLPGESPTSPDAGATEPASPHAVPTSGQEIPRPPGASASFVVLVDKPEDVVARIANISELAKRVDLPYCGLACEAVKTFFADAEGFELEVQKGADLILPPKEMLDAVAVGLTQAERESIHTRPVAIAIRTEGPTTREQLPARAAFAGAAILARALDGLVWDETCRRIESARDFASRTVTSKLGGPVFSPRQIVLQLYRDPDGAAHLRTLGMQRFGAPDLVVRGANMASGPLLAELLNDAARQIVDGANDAPLTIARDGGTTTLDVETAERTEGDPDNDLAELVPKTGKGREHWEGTLIEVFGSTPTARVAADDPELAEIAKRARATLATAQKRGGELFVKGPFAIPVEARADGGAATELLWVAVSSCDAERCTGTLTNEPSYATNIAAGTTTNIAKAAIVDWMIRERDGGTVGGESIRALKARAHRAP